jgi:hypothetical protein
MGARPPSQSWEQTFNRLRTPVSCSERQPSSRRSTKAKHDSATSVARSVQRNSGECLIKCRASTRSRQTLYIGIQLGHESSPTRSWRHEGAWAPPGTLSSSWLIRSKSLHACTRRAMGAADTPDIGHSANERMQKSVGFLCGARVW